MPPYRRPRCSAGLARAPRAGGAGPTNASTPSTTTTSRKPEEPGRDAEPAERQRDQLDDAPAERDQRDDREDHQQDAADPAQHAGARRRGDHAHEAQHQQLAVRRRRAAELLRRDLQVARAALGERQRGLGHPPQLQALLRARGRDRRAEVLARALGVHPLGRAGAEDRLGGGLEARLLLQLLVGAGLELLHGGERRLGLDPDLAWLGRHGASSYGAAEAGAARDRSSSGLGGSPGSGSSAS